MKTLKKTAIDFLVKEISDILGPIKTEPMQDLLLAEAINKAKEMEKQQMKDATLDNVTTNKGLRKIFENQFEQYFSEIYGYKEI
jgi:hypothetical protein